ncbi:MAG: short-chain dehydrogenase [Armatimonadetes bacterium CG_4_10_14_0_8_um_filter_66_14]|nr:SDR family oxidoreductase [Armatimonadota bacterium]NCP29021.1 SDR family oxidoreductase [Armatimonadota bacterium]NCQ26361.1 SDR family oxidoreductase [Armatimonadota bacterium]OIO92854.1 MAG: hypothetical protein AUJ96_31455 [Armatimonadetes bacterium CG2_30_66_41]PIZ47797.1 MAG: short-chain dehydrogenase [Armatimonadetes bacterium CG_4_10_14_0_8_um_filter_66_14]
MTVRDKVILVTGAGRGIGAAICRRLAQDGARVVAAARTTAELDALTEELRPFRDDCLAVPTDLSKPADIARLAETVRREVGRLDVLINNAGIAWGKPTAEVTLEEWRQLLAVNLDAVFLLTRECLPIFQAQGSGQIVNLGSDASLRGISGRACYCASKFALRGFTMALREELKGAGIRLNLVMPGPVNTTICGGAADRWDLIQPEAVAEVVHQVIALPPTADVWEVLVEPGA